MAKKVDKFAFQGRELAKKAGLRYVTDESPGFSRRRRGKGFQYLNCRGKSLRDATSLKRIKALVIPPAWENVWICPFENGHLQCTGFDARQRKQYLYHEKWQSAANLYKFNRLGDFGAVLPSIRHKIRARLKGNTLTSERVLAGIVAILDATSIRVGNEEYVAANNSFGLTTLRNHHLAFESGRLLLRFRGKSGVVQELEVKQKQAVRLIQQAQRLPGAKVFQYLDEEGNRRGITSADVNSFLHELTDDTFTAKDFRTWAASALVAGIFYEQKDAETATERSKTVRAAMRQVAQILGNTVATTRKYYIHSKLIKSFESGDFARLVARFSPSHKQGFTKNEQLLAYFLNIANK